MRYKGVFRTALEDLRVGEECVLRSPRGLEAGVVLSPPRTVEAHPSSACSLAGEIVRRLTEEDRAARRRAETLGHAREARLCRERAAEHGLAMAIAGVERLLDGEKLVVYFLAEGRMDYRTLVRDLADALGCRIEMRQIGPRDEARLLGEYGPCGRRLCCKAWLPELRPISMRMAKRQKATLDPQKIAGRCGRLLCCLRYEDEVYVEFQSSLPRRGEKVETPRGPGDVVEQEILRRRVVVRLASGERVSFGGDEVVRRG
jgi:cell fate regulator YaaT (PSP1 superfamily)